MTIKSDPTTKARYHHGDLRATLVAAAIAQLARQTVAALSLRELARGCGVSVAAVYRHFSSKEALLAEVAAAGFDSLKQRWQSRLPALGTVSAAQRYELLGTHYIEFALAAPAHYRLMFEQQDLRQFPVLQEAARLCFAYVVSTAGDAVREAGAEERWSLVAAGAGWALGHGYVMLLLNGCLGMMDVDKVLSPATLPRFFRLPDEALAPA